jgi:hypothetical protein
MANLVYMNNRKKYYRPQAVLFSNNPGSKVSTNLGNIYVPNGYEIDTDSPEQSSDFFIILSDHNRGPIDITNERVEQKQRMINGKMRSYHIADKRSFSLSWTNFPSRAYSDRPSFDPISGEVPEGIIAHTVDGGAGGNELLDWYKNQTGSFYMFLCYDKRSNFNTIEESSYNRLQEYQEVVEVFFNDFSYDVVKRGSGTYDLWNININLVEA